MQRSHLLGREHVGRRERVFVRQRVGQRRTAPSAEIGPPLPTTALTASMPTSSNAATPAAAIIERERPPRPRRPGSAVTNGIGSSVAASRVRLLGGARPTGAADAAAPRQHMRRTHAACPRRASSSQSRRAARHSPFASIVISARSRRRARIERDACAAVRHAHDIGRVRDRLALDLDEVQQRAHLAAARASGLRDRSGS